VKINFLVVVVVFAGRPFFLYLKRVIEQVKFEGMRALVQRVNLTLPEEKTFTLRMIYALRIQLILFPLKKTERELLYIKVGIYLI
jgi:hypothetical protein